ncbi:uncharacterized protein DFL_005767 [Arthrobotrys flagrans]|uniref:Uncharacterized protein n=1 Tax=Arthrobotrys flagrans TaxID=97331 RepID=A0A436ZYH8_ARTFL|nr:hypothetical protein DFL_005767 [Arthrobotrys flagrans]
MAAKLRRDDYSVGWICAIPIEIEAARKALDKIHPKLTIPHGDENCYEFGEINGHNVVISWLPRAKYGLTNAAIVATRMRTTFTRLRFGLMVGVGGGAPSSSNDIRLGDLVISQPTDRSGGVIQYDFGKAIENGEFKMIGSLNAPPAVLLSGVSAMTAMDQVKLGRRISDAARVIENKEQEEGSGRFSHPGQDSDRLFRGNYLHVPGEEGQRDTCDACDASNVIIRPKRQYSHPHIYYGVIASGNQVMKDGVKRDKISTETGALCFEMEAAGLMDNFPCLVIRGICDYSDGHKNKRWQPYAALVAAVYAKELLLQIPAASKDETEVSAGQKIIKEINFVVPLRIPFPRNPTFVGRKEKLREIHEYFTRTKSIGIPRIFALTGTGGMGKTQIAIEYAYQHYGADYTGVFWVSAVNEDTTRTSFIDIMQCIVEEQARIMWPESTPDYEIVSLKLGIPGLVDSRGKVTADSETISNIQSALFRWLQLPSNNKWLLIFDNADDLEDVDLQKYIPNHGGGAILITSRRPEFSHGAEQTDLGGLDKESAIELLLSLTHIPDSREAVENELIALVEKLGFMPLAISHAGCFIRQTKVSLGGYLLHYDTAFMDAQARKPRFGWNYRSDTASTTWEISFSKIEEQNKEAALLLLICSYLNYEEISEDLWEDEQLDKIEFENRITLLASYSLVKVVSLRAFSIHPVVHSWARERLQQSEKLPVLKNVLTILGKASQRQSKLRQSSKWDAREERRIASHLGYLHRYFEPSFSEIFLHDERAGNKYLFFAFGNMALVFKNQGKYDEAMQWYERALSGKENTLGKDHPSILNTVNNMASVFKNQGKYDEAMQWYERALAGKEKALGKDHPSTLDTVNNMAIVFKKQGKYDEAMQWYERALADYEKTLGKDHLSTLNTVNNMAIVFDKQGKYDEAMQWYERALAGKEKTLGKDHPSTLDIVNNMAIVFDKQGKYDEAMQWHERALAGKEKTLGKDHPSMLDTVHNMALVFDKQGKYDEAMQWYECALAGKEKALGKDHPSTLNTVNNIALVFKNQGKYDEAMQWYERALAGKEKTLGKDHPSILDTVHNMASVFDNQGKYDEAMQWYERALAGKEKTLGKDHPSILDTVDNMAIVFDNQGKYDEAMQWCERALAGKEKALGKDHPSTLDTVNNMAIFFDKQGKYDEAMQWYERALAGSEKTLGKDHPSTLNTVNNIALVFKNQGKYDEAMQWYERALSGKEKALGKNHPSTLNTVNNMAIVFKKQGKYDEAMQWYERALAGKEKALGKNHPSTLDTAKRLRILAEQTSAPNQPRKRRHITCTIA